MPLERKLYDRVHFPEPKFHVEKGTSPVELQELQGICICRSGHSWLHVRKHGRFRPPWDAQARFMISSIIAT